MRMISLEDFAEIRIVTMKAAGFTTEEIADALIEDHNTLLQATYGWMPFLGKHFIKKYKIK